MTSLKVDKGFIPKTIDVPASKSYANRALILAALSSEIISLQNLPDATDVTYLLDSLKAVGLDIQQNADTTIIKNSFPACETKDLTLSVGEGGTTARFLASLLLLGSKKYTLLLGTRLKDRPWQEFIDFIQAHSGLAQLDNDKLIIQGPLKLPSNLKVDCSRTSQFASGLAMVYSLHKVNVIPENLASSQSYWNMTQEMINTFKNSDSLKIPLDWSGASYPLAFSALNQETLFPNLFFDPFQSDAKFLEILDSFGCVKLVSNGIAIKPFNENRSVKLDVSDSLDLVPTLSFFLAHIKGQHELVGISNLKFKESDRLAEIMKLLRAFSKASHTDGHNLFIEGDSNILQESVSLALPDDHRMVMTGALFLRHHAGGTIEPKEAVAKSYPDFFKLFNISQGSHL